MNDTHETHGAGGSYRINEAGDRELVERTKSLDEVKAEAAAQATADAASTSDAEDAPKETASRSFGSFSTSDQ